MTEQELNQKAKMIKLLLLDVDGILTDGNAFFQFCMRCRRGEDKNN